MEQRLQLARRYLAKIQDLHEVRYKVRQHYSFARRENPNGP
jgi:hypothetical protein